MKTNIIDNILSIPKNRILFIFENKQYSYEDISNIYFKNKKTIQTLKNKCIVIHTNKRSDFAILLSILDGQVKRILFLPNDLNASQLDDYYKKMNVNIEVILENGVLKTKEINPNNLLENIKQTEWIIPTSGTTRVPKLIIHTFQSLTRTTKKDIKLGEQYIWGLTFDIFRFSGIQVFLQAILAGSSIIIPEASFSINKILKLFAKHNCNIISATPSFWRKTLMCKEAEQLKLKRITLGGEIVDSSILKALKNRFENAKLTHIYASTEAGAGFAVSDEKAGFPYSYIEEGINGVKLKIDNNSALWIKTGETFIDSKDLVKISGDRVYFLGRKSGIINVGGNKVHPEEVELELIKSNLISQAYIYEKKSPIMGALVCADIVPKNQNYDKQKLKKEVLDYCKNNLASFKIPAILKIVNELSISDNGKIKRK